MNDLLGELDREYNSRIGAVVAITNRTVKVPRFYKGLPFPYNLVAPLGERPFTYFVWPLAFVASLLTSFRYVKRTERSTYREDNTLRVEDLKKLKILRDV